MTTNALSVVSRTRAGRPREELTAALAVLEVTVPAEVRRAEEAKEGMASQLLALDGLGVDEVGGDANALDPADRGFSFALGGQPGGAKQGEAGDEEDEYGDEYGVQEKGSGSEEDEDEGPTQYYEVGFHFQNGFENYF